MQFQPQPAPLSAPPQPPPPSFVIPLPEGWEEHSHPTLRRPYWVYADCDPPFSTWDDPRFVAVQIPQLQHQQQQPPQRRFSNQSMNRPVYAGSESGSAVSYQSQGQPQQWIQQQQQQQQQADSSPYANVVPLPQIERKLSSSSKTSDQESSKKKYMTPILAGLGGVAVAAITGKVYKHFVMDSSSSDSDEKKKRKRKERRKKEHHHHKHHGSSS